MRRLLGPLVADWPLKLGAVVLAAILYVGLVLSADAQVWRGRIPVVPLGQPANAVLLGTIPDVTSIRFLAPAEVASRLTTASFSATIDLGGAEPSSLEPFVTATVVVTATDPRVEILEVEPAVVRVRLDPLVEKEVPVRVERGPVPYGLTVLEPTVTPASVTVSGPESIVRLVDAAQARVLVQPSGLDVDQTVDLLAVDVSGNVLSPVEIEPGSARVRMKVGSQLQTRTLPVRPSLRGSPLDGWEVASVDVVPSVILVEGEVDDLAGLEWIETEPIDLAGASGSLGVTAPLALPAGVSAVGGSAARVEIVLRPATGTRTLQVAVVVAGGRADRSYELSVGRVSVTVGGELALLDAIETAGLVATIDVEGLDVGVRALPVRLELPDGVSLLALSPTTVTVEASAGGPVPAPTASGSP
ncbi:MAG: hypothetical protein RL338_168 [Chloroflexota bacterium]